MKLVTARLVKRYKLRFAPGEDSDRVIRDWKDQFAARPGQLRLEFKLRKQKTGSEYKPLSVMGGQY